MVVVRSYTRLSLLLNSFRIVLNQYFEASLPLLDDRLYYSTKENYYKLEDVTGQIEASCR